MGQARKFCRCDEVGCYGTRGQRLRTSQQVQVGVAVGCQNVDVGDCVLLDHSDRLLRKDEKKEYVVGDGLLGCAPLRANNDYSSDSNTPHSFSPTCRIPSFRIHAKATAICDSRSTSIGGHGRQRRAMSQTPTRNSGCHISPATHVPTQDQHTPRTTFNVADRHSPIHPTGRHAPTSGSRINTHLRRIRKRRRNAGRRRTHLSRILQSGDQLRSVTVAPAPPD